jgi:CheY-like chemotaxis protein
MDIELPGMGGLEAIGLLKSDQRTAAIPVCALTASAMEGDRERCLRAGFDDYMPKPISVSEFPEQVRRWLGGVRGATSA